MFKRTIRPSVWMLGKLEWRNNLPQRNCFPPSLVASLVRKSVKHLVQFSPTTWWRAGKHKSQPYHFTKSRSLPLVMNPHFTLYTQAPPKNHQISERSKTKNAFFPFHNAQANDLSFSPFSFKILGSWNSNFPSISISDRKPQPLQNPISPKGETNEQRSTQKKNDRVERKPLKLPSTQPQESIQNNP